MTQKQILLLNVCSIPRNIEQQVFKSSTCKRMNIRFALFRMKLFFGMETFTQQLKVQNSLYTNDRLLELKYYRFGCHSKFQSEILSGDT